jgi:hypothetical protein
MRSCARCGTGFWPSELKLYVTNRTEYFRRFDKVVHSAEKHGVGLIPSLFWYYACVPNLVGKPCDQWGNPQSRTHAFMREYVREVSPVTRIRRPSRAWNLARIQSRCQSAKRLRASAIGRAGVGHTATAHRA